MAGSLKKLSDDGEFVEPNYQVTDNCQVALACLKGNTTQLRIQPSFQPILGSTVISAQIGHNWGQFKQLFGRDAYDPSKSLQSIGSTSKFDLPSLKIPKLSAERQLLGLPDLREPELANCLNLHPLSKQIEPSIQADRDTEKPLIFFRQPCVYIGSTSDNLSSIIPEPIKDNSVALDYRIQMKQRRPVNAKHSRRKPAAIGHFDLIKGEETLELLQNRNHFPSQQKNSITSDINSVTVDPLLAASSKSVSPRKQAELAYEYPYQQEKVDTVDVWSAELAQPQSEFMSPERLINFPETTTPNIIADVVPRIPIAQVDPDVSPEDTLLTKAYKPSNQKQSINQRFKVVASQPSVPNSIKNFPIQPLVRLPEQTPLNHGSFSTNDSWQLTQNEPSHLTNYPYPDERLQESVPPAPPSDNPPLGSLDPSESREPSLELFRTENELDEALPLAQQKLKSNDTKISYQEIGIKEAIVAQPIHTSSKLNNSQQNTHLHSITEKLDTIIDLLTLFGHIDERNLE